MSEDFRQAEIEIKVGKAMVAMWAVGLIIAGGLLLFGPVGDGAATNEAATVHGEGSTEATTKRR